MTSVVRRASSNTTISSMSPGKVYKDRDLSNGSHTPPKRTKFVKLFTSSIARSASNSKSSLATPTPSASSVLSTASSKNALMNSKHDSSSTSINSNGTSTPAPVPSHSRRNARTSQDGNTRTPPPHINIKPDRRKDIKLTNCQEKDGVWTATGQFGRESRHSKRAEISYDKKKFKFTQRDEQGNKHVFEINASDVDGMVLTDNSLLFR